MIYLLQHKKHGTFYCINGSELKNYSVDVKDATRFENKSNAEKIRKKLKHPENWIIKEIRKNGTK